MKKLVDFETSVCMHEWEKQKFVGEDYYKGHIVNVYRCKCKKCGAVRLMKFWKSEVK